MQSKLFGSKKRIAALAVAAAVLAAGGAAFAYFTSSGAGAGSAQTGSASNVTISQVGAGYDSLISTNSYSQDQCLSGCSGPDEIGNDITLSSSASYQQLVNVVVGIDNWGAAVTAVPMTLTINNTAAGPISDTVSASFPAATNPGTLPSETNVTFDFSPQDAFVSNEFVYGLTFNSTPGAAAVPAADSLNVALSSSANDLSVGTDTHPGTIWIDDAGSDNGDFPTCTALPTSGFAQVSTSCGPALETGAYGTTAQVAAGNDDIPAVEINVVGGTVTGLYPGAPAQPIEYAITNPGTSPVQVNTVSVSLDTTGTDVESPAPASQDVTGCLASWYQLNNSPQTIGQSIPPGTTLFTTNSATATTLSIQMLNPDIIQNACEGADIGLSFTSN